MGVGRVVRLGGGGRGLRIPRKFVRDPKILLSMNDKKTDANITGIMFA